MLTTIPDDVCPQCSYLRADHPELLENILRYASAIQGRRGKLWRVFGCRHLRDITGPYETEQDALNSIAVRFERLRTEKALESELLNSL